MTNIASILQLRFYQALRLLKTVGVWLLLIVLPLLLVLVLQLLEAAKEVDERLIAFILVAGAISLHIQRKDVAFLQKLELSLPLLFLVEYTLLFLPITLLLAILFNKWLTFLLTHLGLSLIIFIPNREKLKKGSRSIALNWLPVQAFEIKAGIRQYWLLFLILYLAGIVLGKFVFMPLLTILLSSLLAISFYDEFEPRELLEKAYFKNNWLWQKAWLQIGVFLALFSPHILVFLFFHWSLWYILFAALVVMALLLLFALFYKYASYHPGRRKVYNQTAFGLYLVGFFIPFFFPASLFYLVVYYRRAKRQLNYFYAKN